VSTGKVRALPKFVWRDNFGLSASVGIVVPILRLYDGKFEPGGAPFTSTMQWRAAI